jgi:hypothetical protein
VHTDEPDSLHPRKDADMMEPVHADTDYTRTHVIKSLQKVR